MADIKLNALDVLEISVNRTDDEHGNVVLVIETDDDRIEIDAGRFRSDADSLHDILESALEEAKHIRDDWEDRPDSETDGFVCEQSPGYSASLSGTVAGYNFPTRDIAEYELAKLIADSGYGPNLWYQNERGNTEPIRDIHKYSDPGTDGLLPLDGVKYETGDEVVIGSDGYPYVVDHDYGKLGVMLHISGDPGITEFEQHDNLKPFADDDE